MTEVEWLASDDLDELLQHVCELRRSELGITDPQDDSWHPKGCWVLDLILGRE
jgi:hypothetical protein